MSLFNMGVNFAWVKTCDWKGASWTTCPLDLTFYLFLIASGVVGIFELATTHFALFAMNYDKKLTK